MTKLLISLLTWNAGYVYAYKSFGSLFDPTDDINNNWDSKNFLEINNDKTEVRVIGSETQRKDILVYLDFLSVKKKKMSSIKRSYFTMTSSLKNKTNKHPPPHTHTRVTPEKQHAIICVLCDISKVWRLLITAALFYLAWELHY